MAYALVGSIGTVATAASPVTPAFAQATTAGNLLIGWVASSTGAGGITSSSTGWFLAINQSNLVNAAVFYRFNCGAGEAAPTFTCSGTTMWAALGEFSGGKTSAPFDNSGGNGGIASPVVAVATAVDTAAGELFVTSGSHLLSMSGTTVTADTYNNGATPTGNLNNDAASNVNHYRFAYGITTGKSAADQTSQSDTSASISRIAVAVASFLLAPAAAAVIPDVGMALTVT